MSAAASTTPAALGCSAPEKMARTGAPVRPHDQTRLFAEGDPGLHWLRSKLSASRRTPANGKVEFAAFGSSDIQTLVLR